MGKIKIGLAILTALLLTLIAGMVPVGAIIWGQPDGDAHPYVGLVVFYDESGVPQWRCSGTLISKTVFLTAGHCTFGASRAQVWFDPGPIPADPEWSSGESCTAEEFTGYPCADGTWGSPYTHPDYDNFATFPNTSDVGIVVLEEPVYLAPYGELPAIGALNSLHPRRGLTDQLFRIVGYGLQAVVPSLVADRERYNADPFLIDLNSALTGGYNIHLSANPGKRGSGGACFGDSGGPALYPKNSNVVVGVGSFVLNQNCVGSGYYYRIDTEEAQEFITSFP